MFFKLTEDMNDVTFSEKFELPSGAFLYTDLGWDSTVINDVLYIFKGYSDDVGLITRSNVLLTIERAFTDIGNYAIFADDGNTVSLYHDKYRSFLLTYNKELKYLTNLFPEHETDQRIPATAAITISTDFEIVQRHYGINELFNYPEATLAEVIDKIDLMLTTRFTSFFQKNTLPVKIFVSGGVDTILCWSYLKKLGIDYELVLSEYLNSSVFVDNHIDNVKKYWGYTQIHSFDSPTVLVSGAMGDEVLMRGPLTVNWWMLANGLNIVDLLNETHYHNYYHLKDASRQSYLLQPPEGDIRDKIIDTIVNDHQHWHLDQTITFTPFKDMEITRMLLSLPINDLLGQMLNAEINKEIIQRNAPELIELISKQKNAVHPSKVDYTKFLKGL